MLSPISEAIYSATYVDNYLDSVENLPDDVQRCLSRIHDIDVQYRGILRDVDHYYDLWKTLQNSSDATAVRKNRAIARMQQGLIQAQELGDEKMGIVNQLQEIIDQKTRQLDGDQKRLNINATQNMQRSDPTQDDCGPTPTKHSRAQSPPARGMDQGLSNINGGAASSGSGLSGGGAGVGGGGSTPNSERSSNGVMNGISTSNTNVVGGERSLNKRSRRRNDNLSGGNIELGGNESNSANEGGGSNGGNPIPLQKSSSSSGAQRKSSGQSIGSGSAVATGTSSTSGSGGAGLGSGNNSGKKKKRKSRGGQSSSAQANAREETPPPDAIDPDEPTYCLCNQISFGEMILCDNDLCPIEWFHFSCVTLTLKPKGKWFCPNCRGDRPNVMKPKAQFLKELERFNKEKEGG